MGTAMVLINSGANLISIKANSFLNENAVSSNSSSCCFKHEMKLTPVRTLPFVRGKCCWGIGRFKNTSILIQRHEKVNKLGKRRDKRLFYQTFTTLSLFEKRFSLRPHSIDEWQDHLILEDPRIISKKSRLLVCEKY